MCKQQILKNSPNCFSSGKTLSINWTKQSVYIPKYMKNAFSFPEQSFFYIYTMIQKQFRKNWKLKKNTKNFNLLYSRW